MNTLKEKSSYRPEILAPAGTREALEAAVKAGADAVYAGGTLYSARAFAGNFDTESLTDAIGFCHFYGAKLYMTVNTLFKDEEIGRLSEYIAPFYEAGVDAVLVQDMGAARVITADFPDLPLHASTQMSVASSYGARYLKSLGFTRVVPARELTLEEIRSIKEKADIEVETFVHGAMCYAYSGKCLLSSFMGGRSGNRGRCAQPCRQCYEMLSASAGNAPKVREYMMSLKDMCTVSVIPELMAAGIDSFKIEGRMKNPSYVAAVTSVYAAARDLCLENGGTLPPSAVDDLKDIYNRGGFHTGYYYTKKGPEMAANKRPNHQGLLLGEVQKVSGPDVFIRLAKDMNAGDVLEIRRVGNGEPVVELTAASSGKSGSVTSVKGRELKKIRPGMEVYRTRNNALLERIDREIISPEKKVRAYAFVSAKVGQPLSIVICEGSAGARGYSGGGLQYFGGDLQYSGGSQHSGCDMRKGGSGSRYPVRDMRDSDCNMRDSDCAAQYGGSGPDEESVCVQVCGDIVERASKQPTQAASLKEKMAKTGGLGLELEAEIDIDGNAFVPMSAFNDLRRRAAEAFRAAKVGRYRRKPVTSRMGRKSAPEEVATKSAK